MARSFSLQLAVSLWLVGCGMPQAAAPPPSTEAQTPPGGATPAPVDGGGAAPSDGGAADGAHAVAAIADGFEGATLDGSRWTVLGAEGHQAPSTTTALVDGVRAHSGKQSLHVHDGFIETRPPGAAFYGRAFVWFDADPGAGHWMSWVGVGPGGAQGTEVRYGGHYDILEANYLRQRRRGHQRPQGVLRSQLHQRRRRARRALGVRRVLFRQGRAALLARRQRSADACTSPLGATSLRHGLPPTIASASASTISRVRPSTPGTTTSRSTCSASAATAEPPVSRNFRF